MDDLKLEIAHIGINNENTDSAESVSNEFSELLNLSVRNGEKSIFVGSVLEILKMPFIGTHGHIALKTPDLDIAMDKLRKKGYEFQMDTLKCNEQGEKVAIYFDKEIGGFAIHLLKG